ncbi:GNAT family N-acetyltransferase [Rheinheimera sp. 4Y26]|uniref:GNAT family N-acetyltransferase n=1 Tax=Rheinheimera sp. 4Y26 TaxID=2977811 RepID=UPI0021B08FBA|nr:GNAT family N-acetyltransferase [Rheinheimera sp. 4Y26]MCT6699265.1 GNAT family N-acetyltransferase [Rheinheimera sp. 4Y26]
MVGVHLIVREAKPEDALRLSKLYNQLVSNPAVNVEPEQIQALYDDSRSKLFVCDYQGNVVGSALVSLCSDVMFRNQPFAVVENVIVDVVARGLGVGTALFKAIEVFCVGTNCSKIMLLSSSQRLDSHAFFEKQGFKGEVKRGFVKYRSAFTSAG